MKVITMDQETPEIKCYWCDRKAVRFRTGINYTVAIQAGCDLHLFDPKVESHNVSIDSEVGKKLIAQLVTHKLMKLG